MNPLTLSNVNTVLCIGCHADDIEIGCGATILRLLKENSDLSAHWVVLSADEQRTNEARRSAEGFLENKPNARVEVQDFTDSYFPSEFTSLKKFFHQLAQRVDPDVIFTHRKNDAHQDHRLASELTWCAFRNQLILEYEIPKYEGDLDRPNVYLPVELTLAKRKLELIAESFASQRDKPWFQREVFESLMRIRGIECKSASGFAEAFHASKMVI